MPIGETISITALLVPPKDTALMERYYYDSFWRVWVRRLLTTSGRKIDISLTTDTGNWDEVKEERIRVHNTADRDKKFVSVLPSHVKASMFENLGPVLTYRLLSFKYIKVIGLEKLLYADRDYKTGGGVPAQEVLVR